MLIVFNINSSGAIVQGIYGTAKEPLWVRSTSHVGGVTIAAVPVPSAFFLFGSGLIGLLGIRIRR